MRLVDDAEFVLHRAWSLRLMLLSFLLSGLEVAVNVLVTYQVDVHIPPGTFAAMAGLVTIAAGAARFIAQRRD